MSQSNDAADSWVITTTQEEFQAKVFQQSVERPIVVDFWAEWCAPCRALGPVLEKMAGEYAGEFILVKANTEENPQSASEFQVQGIPAVYAVVNEKVVEMFNGALPETQIRVWMDRVISIGLLIKANQLENDSPESAEKNYRTILSKTPDEVEAQLGLARVLLGQNKFDDVRQIIDKLESRGFLEPEAEKIKANLALHGKQGGDLQALRDQVTENPDNLSLQLTLAETLAGSKAYEEALSLSLSLVQKDKTGVGDAARKLMIDIFRVLPDNSPLVSEFRRKLSTALF